MADKLHGVNLGGWLVLEKWLTPGLFEGTPAVDEYTFMKLKDSKKRINKHRDSFITERDFKWMAENSIEIVRIPVGYWLFESVDGYDPSKMHLDKAMRWADQYGIKVLIDLHAARGSQNGFDNSGRTGIKEWYKRKDYRQQTLVVLTSIAERYAASPALWGIELLNEPTPGRHQWMLMRFHRRAYKKLRTLLPPGTAIVFHDAFHPWLHVWTFMRKYRERNPIYMDVHWYAFPFKTRDLEEYLKQSFKVRRRGLTVLQLWRPVIVGEWSSVLPQRFFAAVPKDQHMDLLKKCIDMQREAYSDANAWMYWNYKAEGEGMWNYRSLVEQGIID